MGKKEKFIDKANSQKFHLLHRSQRDEAHQNHEVPSNFVLVAAVDNGNGGSNSNSIRAPARTAGSGTKSAPADHINELGFANDGYDYSQHLKEMGGGNFIPRGGSGHGRDKEGAALDLQLITAQSKAIELPDDCLPSEGTLDRHLEAITINPELMDKDIRAALFDGFDENGEFEELQDDFITEVMGEPEENDFDFDAHIARLIAQSEQSLGVNNNTRANKHVKFAGQPDDEEDEEFPDAWLQDNIYNAQNKQRTSLPTGAEAGEAVDPLSAEAREALEVQFEKTLEEYAEEELGYLSDLEEEEIGGEIDIDDVTKHAAFNSAMEEFLQEQRDNLFVEGTNVKKGSRASVQLPGRHEGDNSQEEEEEMLADGGEGAERKEKRQQERNKKAKEEQEQRQHESYEELVTMLAEGTIKNKEIETCQEYLQDVREEEAWDCETILTTYSTLDNHPTLIKNTNSKYIKYKSKHAQAQEAAAAASALADSSSSITSASAAGSIGGIRNAPAHIYTTTTETGDSKPAVPKVQVRDTPGRIVLSGRLNLPEGFGPSRFEKQKLEKQEMQRAAARQGTKKLDSLGEEEDEEEGSDCGEGEEDYKNHQDGGATGRSGGLRRKKETPEEKKARKEAVKLQRRSKRVDKKELKNAYKSEGSKIIRHVGAQQSIDNVSLFRYS